MATPASSQSYQNPNAPLTQQELARRAAFPYPQSQPMAPSPYPQAPATPRPLTEAPAAQPPVSPVMTETRPSAPVPAASPEARPVQEVPMARSAQEATAAVQAPAVAQSRAIEQLAAVPAAQTVIAEPTDEIERIFEGPVSANQLESVAEKHDFGKTEQLMAELMDNNHADPTLSH